MGQTLSFPRSHGLAHGIFVLGYEADHARELVKEFLNTVTDEQVLEEAAAQKLKLDKETVTQLRGALKEERQTFEFLGWIGEKRRKRGNHKKH